MHKTLPRIFNKNSNFVVHSPPLHSKPPEKATHPVAFSCFWPFFALSDTTNLYLCRQEVVHPVPLFSSSPPVRSEVCRYWFAHASIVQYFGYLLTISSIFHTQKRSTHELQNEHRSTPAPPQHGRPYAFPRRGQTPRRSRLPSRHACRQRPPAFLAYGALVGEILAPLAIIFGLFTRGAAAVVAFNMLVAIAMVHLGDLCAVNPQTGGWAVELPMLYLLSSLALVYTGGGRFAVSNKTWLD